MNNLHAALLVVVVTLVTIGLRFLPFLIFGENRKTPPLIAYLGQVLPPAIIAMLIVYCLKGISFAAPGGWVPTLLAGGAAVLLHLWKGNDLLSIFGATVLYMVLVQGVFG